jgi:methionyl-tRNA synthetase
VDVQVLGKDILRFHLGIWPAMLLGLELPLPKKMLVHGFVNVGGAKMSKTVGNVVDPNQVIDGYGVDAFRYFFSRHIPTQDDGDFTWEKFENAYNNELGNDLGNLVSRVASMVSRYQSGVIGDAPKGDHDMKPYFDAVRDLKFNVAMDETWETIRALNKYIEMVKPWEIAGKRDKEPEAEAHLGEVLGQAVGTLLQVADQLTPFLPDTAEAIKRIFGTGVIVPLEKEGGLFPKIYLHTPNPRANKEQ